MAEMISIRLPEDSISVLNIFRAISTEKRMERMDATMKLISHACLNIKLLFEFQYNWGYGFDQPLP